MQKKIRKEKGSVVVEASIGVPVFFVAVLLIINLINIFCLHNRIQFAINSAAHEISSYSYILAKTGLIDAERTVESDGSDSTSKIDKTSDSIVDCLNSIQTLKGDVDSLKDQVQNAKASKEYVDNLKDSANKTKEDAKDAYDKGKDASGNVVDRFKDPKGTVVGIGYLGADALTYFSHHVLGAGTARIFTKKYLEMENMGADQYLMAYGVRDGYNSLDFSGSSVLADDKKQLIDIVVKYDVSLSCFGLVFDEADPKLTIVQRVTVPAWTEGDGKKVGISKKYKDSEKPQKTNDEEK